MNTINGRIFLEKSSLGISNLLVVICDIDPGTRPEEAIPESAGLAAPCEGDRLGSVLTRQDGQTGQDGWFELVYEDTEFQVRNAQEKRPDLLLSVWAPEQPGVDPKSRLLYTSPVRQDAGHKEAWMITLSEDQLRKAGITPPSSVPQDGEPAPSVLGQLKENVARQTILSDGSIEIVRQRMEAHRQRYAGFGEKLKPALLASLSRLPAAPPDPERFVKPGESPFEKSRTAIVKGIQETINSDDPQKRAPARGFISLTQDQVDELRQQTAPDGTVPETAVTTVASRNGQTARTTYVQAADRLPLCGPKTPQIDCTSSLLDPASQPLQPPQPVVPGSGVDSITSNDVPRYLARLMETLTAPEEELVTGLTPAATQDSVKDSVQNLLFPPSPADVPAFHDFSSLQIAFRHVWQEAIDQGIIDVAQDAYETIVELGGDPTREEYLPLGPLGAIVAEGRAALKAGRLARVRDHRGNGEPEGGVSVTETPPGGATADGGASCACAGDGSAPGYTSGWVTTGNVRDHRTTRSDNPAERLPALLEQLQKMLLENYTFTVYAANSQERSVNFGILNTFRQVWTPLSYQAGPLVKSIPLAPKQTQKVVITRKTTKKRTRKELENNLRVTKEETSQTNRAEQEIARRAEQKNDFSLETQAEGDYGAGSAKVTTKMSQEASKSSDDIKKSFRESVFKSAQEFKQERTTEVNTEETESAEVTETTEITNPNDEIAVTFLFYELQRRYRIFERLYRVQPVVLVAQECPRPDEINQAWLVAHDWILKRIILDDSFLPILNSLCQTAGDETALAEMKENVDQQRCIVNQLRQQLAIAERNVAAIKQVLERTVTRAGGIEGIFGYVEDIAGNILSASAAKKLGDMLFSGDAQQAQNYRQALQDRIQQAADDTRDLMYRLEREVTALNALLESYTKALREHNTRLTEITRLEVHVKKNIFYYMQGIWRHEPRDQRYFRLHNVPVPDFTHTARHFKVDFANPLPTMMGMPHMALPRFGGKPVQVYPVVGTTKVDDQLQFKPLSEVADLDNLLGFKGNYAIFPLLESNPLTDFMMDPYVDRATGQLVDPSDPLNWSIDEFSQYVCCLKDKVTTAEFNQLLPQLQQVYQAILSNPTRNDDVLVVPTNSLFIEALPAAHSLIEKFKAAHRMIDVKKAQGEAREKELENVRRAAKLLAGERGDPHIDKKVLVEGHNGGVLVPE